MTEFGKTPYLTTDEFAELGYKIVIFPVTLQRVAAKAVADVLATLKAQRSQKSVLDRMQTRAELYDLLGYHVDGPTGPPPP